MRWCSKVDFIWQLLSHVSFQTKKVLRQMFIVKMKFFFSEHVHTNQGFLQLPCNSAKCVTSRTSTIN